METTYSKGTTPYGDVYIPNKIANYLKDGCGAYQMDVALQDVEGLSRQETECFPMDMRIPPQPRIRCRKKEKTKKIKIYKNK